MTNTKGRVADYDQDSVSEKGGNNDLELEVVPDRMTTPDDSVEADYDIVEVAHTPGFGDENTVTKFKRIATVFSGNMSLICSTLGTGILGLPYALYELGVVPGVILIIVLGLICMWTMWMLEEVGVALCKEEQVKDNTLTPKVNISYTWVGARVSPRTGVFLDLIMLVIAAGIVIAFVIAFCDSFTSIMKYVIDGVDSSSSGGSSESDSDDLFGGVSASSSADKGGEAFYKRMLKSRIFWAIVMYIIDVPMSYAKSLNSLRYFSFFVIPCVIYFIIIFIYFTATEGTKSVNIAPESANGIKAIPIVMFIYTGHMNVNKIISIHNNNNDHTIIILKYIKYSYSYSLFITIHTIYNTNFIYIKYAIIHTHIQYHIIFIFIFLIHNNDHTIIILIYI